MSDSPGDGTDEPSRLGKELCDRRIHFYYIFTFSAFFLLFMLPYLLVAETNSALYVVVVMNVVGLVVFGSISGAVLWYCKRNF